MELRRLLLRGSYWGKRGNDWKVLRGIYGGCLCVSGVQQQRWRRFWRFHFLASKRTIMRPSPQPESPPPPMLPRRRQQLRCTPRAAFLPFLRFPKPLHSPARRRRPKQIKKTTTHPDDWCPGMNLPEAIVTSTSTQEALLVISTTREPLAGSLTTRLVTSG